MQVSFHQSRLNNKANLVPASFLETLWEKLTKFQKAYKKFRKFTLLRVVQSENKNLAPIVLSIPKISKDSIKRSNRLYLLQNLFCLHCSREQVENTS